MEWQCSDSIMVRVNSSLLGCLHMPSEIPHTCHPLLVRSTMPALLAAGAVVVVAAALFFLSIADRQHHRTDPRPGTGMDRSHATGADGTETNSNRGGGISSADRASILALARDVRTRVETHPTLPLQSIIDEISSDEQGIVSRLQGSFQFLFHPSSEAWRGFQLRLTSEDHRFVLLVRPVPNSRNPAPPAWLVEQTGWMKEESNDAVGKNLPWLNRALRPGREKSPETPPQTSLLPTTPPSNHAVIHTNLGGR